MLSNFRFRCGGVSRVLGVSALLAVLFAAGCSSGGSAPFAVTTTSGQLAKVVINSAYPSTTLTAANGTAPYTWTITGGALPTGLQLSSAGVLSGMPTVFGTFNFTVTVTDSATPTAHTATGSLSVLINPAIASVGLSPTTEVGGASSTATVTLSGAAAAAATVTLSSSNASATVPASVTVAAGATTATFQVTTTAVSSSAQAIVTATYGVSKTATLTVNPPTVSSDVLALSTVTGGAGTTGTVTLSGPAATGGDTVTLSSDNAAALVPATVSVPAGQTTAQFNVTTTAVSSNATAHIQASFNSTSQSATLTVVPAPTITSFTAAGGTITSGTSTTLTAVFANGTGSVSNSVGTVTSGTPATVQPTTTTTYTLTVTNAAGTSVTRQATVTVVAAPSITSLTSAAATITAGTSTTLTGIFTGGTGSIDNAVGAVTSGAAATVSPATTTTYTLTVTNTATTPATTTKMVTVTVVPAPTITSFSPALATIVSGNSTTLTAVFSNGTGTIDNSVGPVTSGTPVTVTPAATTTYTLTVTNSATVPASVTSTTTVTVHVPPSITSGSSASFVVGTNGSFTVQGTGNPSPTFVETGALPANVIFTDNGNGTATLHGTPASGTDASSPYHFTITASNGVPPSFVQNFTLSVVLVQAPAITTQPTNQTVTVGNNATFTAAASGAPVPTVQWQVSTNGGTTFTNLSGQTSATLTLTAVTISQNAYQYRAVFTNSVNSATTNAATLTVVPAPTITSFTPASPTITSGSSTTLTAVFNAGTGGNASVDNGVGAVTSGTAVSVSPTSNTTYTLTVTNAAGTSVTQQTTVTVVPAPVITSFTPGATTITSGNSTTLTAVFNTGTGISASIDNSVGTVTSGTPVTVFPTTTTTYTLTVSNSAGAKVTQPVTIIVDTPPGISSNNSVTFTVGVNGNFPIQGTGTPLPTFIETGALPNNVTFVDNGDGTATLSGIPQTGTAGTYPITITAHNIVGPDFVQSFTLTVISDPCSGIGTGLESMLNGHYAFTLQGFDNGQASGETTVQPALVGGVLTANGSGTITAGTLDMNLFSTAGLQSLSMTGTYIVGSDHRACLTFTTSQGSTHYRASLANISSGVASTGHVIGFDAAGPFIAGELRKQDTTAFSISKVTGNYAFEMATGQENTISSAGEKQAIAGIIRLSTGSLIGGELDLNDGGSLEGNNTVTAWPTSAAGLTINSGTTYSIDATSGRGTLTVSVTQGTPPNQQTVTLTDQIYVVSASDFLILADLDQTQSGGITAIGEALQQSGPFTLSGTDVIHLSSFNLNSGPGNTSNPPTSDTLIGTIAIPSAGNFTFNAWENNGGTIGQQGPQTGTYSIDSAGRMLLTSGGGNHSPVFYLVSANKAFVLGGSQGVETGMVEPQTAKTMSGAFAGGTIDPQDPNDGASEFVVTFSGGAVSGTSDDNSSGSPSPNSSIPSTPFSIDSTGLGSIGSSGCTIGGTGSSGCQLIFYVISSTHGVLMDLTNEKGNAQTNPTLQFADQ